MITKGADRTGRQPTPRPHLPSRQRDFTRVWHAYAVSAAGTAVGAGALPLVAVTTLHATALQVSLLAALSSVPGAVIALWLGGRIEHRTKRPVMIAADLARAVALASVPLAAALGLLTFGQLCAVGVVQAAATTAFLAASTAHLKALVAPEARLRASARFETTDWLSQSAGPPSGGLLVGALGTTATVAVDALSFALSALGISRLQTPEPEPPPVPASRSSAGVSTGWRTILAHPGLRPLFWNALLFGGPVMATVPLLAVLMLQDMHFTPIQYGLALGLPCLGGILGSRCTLPLTRRLGAHRVLLAFGVLRTPWALLLAFVPLGRLGLVAIVAIDTGLLFAVGVFNPAFAAYRMAVTDDHVIARVVTAWSVSAKTAQPACMLAAGLLASQVGVRPALLVAGTLCLASAALLPWTAAAPDPAPAAART
ncbi:MFS transporter [Streptomyces sp. NK08204]|uniref:MFS transporter n=1 Tax=Streptomyces sp. NK08204 TaxID=2873260 RepID=UPI001CEC2F18|nr:MFS transporter [Streptomyces sp. NK08204]